MHPILLIGGYGSTGRMTAKHLRDLHPDVPLAIAGRNLEAAQSHANELGNAVAYRVDIAGDEPDMGLPHGNFSAMGIFLMDDTGNATAFAGRHKIPNVAVTGGAFELGQQVIVGMHAARTSPVIIAGNWYCGGMLWPVLDLCSNFTEIDSVEVGIVIDRNGGNSGPAVAVDFGRILRSCATMPQRADKHYHWISAEEGQGTYIGTGNRLLEGKPAVSCDAISIGAWTGARNVRVLETWGDSLSFLEKGLPSDEIAVEVTGKNLDGNPVRLRQEIVAPRQSVTLTSISVALLLEKAAGLGDSALAPGLYLSEQALEPRSATQALAAAGVQFSEITTTAP